MHIADGVVSTPILVIGAAVTAALCAYGLRRLTPERIPQAAMLSAVVFVAALVHFPVGPGSVHLVLTGLAGVLLGWAAAPAILVAVVLQAVLFGFGGVTVLGVNAMNMALPAVLSGALFACLLGRLADRPERAAAAAGGCGALAVLLSALAVAASLALSGEEFVAAAWLVVLTNLPVMVVEGVFTAAVVGLLLKVKPEAVAPFSAAERAA